ncbi:MAG: site-specific integrase [Gammaproteobacteria bacterium]|nr:site-specific integrase [Gammaproteobacteria bacterium]
MTDERTSAENLFSGIRGMALAENTRKAYRKGWACFAEYCRRARIADPLTVSPETVATFLISLTTQGSPKSGQVLSMGTVALYASAITKQYVSAGLSSPTRHPTVTATLKGLARLNGTAPRQVMALRENHIEAMLAQCPDTPIGCRDAAILALGFAAALRRSEICALRVSDINIVEPRQGAQRRMLLTIRRSKTDQTGKGHKIAVPEGKVIRPIQRLEAWLLKSDIRRGPLFQSMKRGGHVQGKPLHHSDIPRLLKHYAAGIGLDPESVSGHSLRAGFVTSAVAHHARLDKIMEVTRHRNPASVMKYVRDANSFEDHAGEMFL